MKSLLACLTADECGHVYGIGEGDILSPSPVGPPRKIIWHDGWAYLRVKGIENRIRKELSKQQKFNSYLERINAILINPKPIVYGSDSMGGAIYQTCKIGEKDYARIIGLQASKSLKLEELEGCCTRLLESNPVEIKSGSVLAQMLRKRL